MFSPIRSINPVRRVRRVLNLFASVTMNSSSPYDQPYTSQLTRNANGPRVF